MKLLFSLNWLAFTGRESGVWISLSVSKMLWFGHETSINTWGGFMGGHAVKRLKSSGYWIRSVDIKKHEYGANPDEFIKGNLCDPRVVQSAFEIGRGEVFDEIYQFAADMGGAGYIFTGENDAQVMYNSALINLNVLNEIHEGVRKVIHGMKEYGKYSS